MNENELTEQLNLIVSNVSLLDCVNVTVYSGLKDTPKVFAPASISGSYPLDRQLTFTSTLLSWMPDKHGGHQRKPNPNPNHTCLAILVGRLY